VSDWRGLDRELRLRFGVSARYHVTAPGRVNLIGEHTDYNEGFVLPAAIDRAVRLAAAPLGESVLRVWSSQFNEAIAIPLHRLEEPALPAWARYLQGVAIELAREGVGLRGTAAVVDGDLPRASGLSSSAALEIAGALAFAGTAGASIDPRRLALLAQRAEVEFVGVRCGIMDQLSVLMGRAGHALLIDCRSLDVSPVPMPDHLLLVVCDTGVQRALGGSGYNQRRVECEEALRRLQAARPIGSLRDLTPADLPLVERLPEPLGRRVRHVITENERVREAAEHLRAGEGAAAGRLLDASHASLRTDFEVSSPELDAMVGAARAAGALGARLTGAGFGGAAIALVAGSAVAAFLESVAEGYTRSVGRLGTFMVCHPADGARLRAVSSPE
jgi:galactokinase